MVYYCHHGIKAFSYTILLFTICSLFQIWHHHALMWLYTLCWVTQLKCEQSLRNSGPKTSKLNSKPFGSNHIESMVGAINARTCKVGLLLKIRLAWITVPQYGWIFSHLKRSYSLWQRLHRTDVMSYSILRLCISPSSCLVIHHICFRALETDMADFIQAPDIQRTWLRLL